MLDSDLASEFPACAHLMGAYPSHGLLLPVSDRLSRRQQLHAPTEDWADPSRLAISEDVHGIGGQSSEGRVAGGGLSDGV